MTTSLKIFRVLRILAFALPVLFICSVFVSSNLNDWTNSHGDNSPFVLIGIVLSIFLFLAAIFCIIACLITGWRMIGKGQLRHRQLLLLYIVICMPGVLYIGVMIIGLIALGNIDDGA